MARKALAGCDQERYFCWVRSKAYDAVTVLKCSNANALHSLVPRPTVVMLQFIASDELPSPTFATFPS